MSETDKSELLRRIEAGETIPFSERRPAVCVGVDPGAGSWLLGEMAVTAGVDDEPTVDESDLPTLVRVPR